MKRKRFRQQTAKLTIFFLLLCLVSLNLSQVANVGAQNGDQTTPQPNPITPTPTLDIDQQKEELENQSSPNIFTLSIPSNDDFSFAKQVSNNPYVDNIDTTGATVTADDPIMGTGCGIGTNSNTVWYQFTAQSNGTLYIDTLGSNYDTVLAAFTGSRGNLALVDCNDDFSGLQSHIEFQIRSGETYYIDAADYSSPSGGQLQITVSFVLASQIDYNSLYASANSDLWRINPNTGVFTYIGPIGYQGTDIAFDGKKLYGINFSQFLSIDPVTGTGSIIGSIGYSDVNALTVSPNGTMYAGTVSGALLRINKSTGAGTLIGYYGSGLGSSGDLAIRNDNTMYASVTRSGYYNDWLAQINMSTGKATLIGDIGESGVFGIDAKDWILYGVTSSGYLLRINVTTGQGTRIASTSAGFWGLSVSGLTPPPVILVHGWQGFSAGYNCNEGIEKYDGSNSTLNSTDNSPDLADWLVENGYEVWIAHLESNPLHTDTLEKNAKCLSEQIETVWRENSQDITIIAHSMGGVVSRAAIRSLPSNVKVEKLFTLGSPHAGIPLQTISRFIGVPIDTYCLIQPAVCQMSPDYMNNYNQNNPNLNTIQYNFFGGDGGSGPMWLALLATLQGSNDGLVGQYSAVGWAYPLQISLPNNWLDQSEILGQYFTNETHPAQSQKSLAYYVAPQDEKSESYMCIRDLMQDSSDAQQCQFIEAQSLQTNNTEVNSLSFESPSFTETKTGHLDAGQGISIPLTIDSVGATVFYLNWNGGTAPLFTLTRPDAVVVTPQYALNNPTIVTYETESGSPEAAPYQAYSFVTGQVGVWQLNITASSDPIDFQAFGIIDSSRTLDAQTNKEIYEIGEIALITATLDSSGSGLVGATVNANLTSPNGVEALLSLTDNLDGTYTGSYPIPNAPGFLTIDITANGNDGGVSYTRNINLLVAIAPNDLQLTGSYDDQPRDDNADGIYDFLDFSAVVNLASPGEYTVSAELYAGNQLITQSGDFLQLVAGTQTVSLPFDGGVLREAGLNGPYTVKNLYFTPIDIGITAASVENAWTTSAYSYTQFSDKTSPQVSSVTRANPNPTGAASVNFTVTFSESVVNVDTSDFIPTTTGIVGAFVTNVSGSGATRTVSVNTGSGSGTIRLNVVDNNSIVDASANPLGGAVAGDGNFTSGETYTITKIPLPSSWVGGVSISSDKNVVAVGRPHIGAEVMTYDGFSSGSTTSYIPMLFKDAFGGTYDAAFYVQNMHATNTANITIKYYDSVGNLSCTVNGETIAPLASKGYWLPGQSCLSAGWTGGVVVTSDQPIVAIGRPHIGAEVMTYNGFTAGSTTSYIPMLFKDAFGGSYDSAFYIQNVHAVNTANITIKYYDSAGALSCTVNDTVQPLASKGYWVPGQGCLPVGWTGGVVVTSNQPIVGVGRPHIGNQVTTYNGFSAGVTSSYVPMLFKDAFGGSYDAAFYIQNVHASNTANIAIKYYDSAGNLTCTVNDTVQPLASKGYWVPGVSCLPAGWVGGVVVTSSQPIVGVGRPHIAEQVTTYNGFTAGSLSSYIPMMFKDAFGGSYDSALYIQNTEASAAVVTVKFYDSTGALTCTRNDSIPALSTLGLWIPSTTCSP